jgi:hypothetical protein
MPRPQRQNTVDPESVLSSETTLRRIMETCRKNFSDENEADECFNFILDQLKSDNFQRLRSYKGDSHVNTFVYTVVNRLVVDFRRSRYGRRRIPAGVKKLGRWAERVYDLVCWKKFTYDDAFDIVSGEKLFDGPYTEYTKRIETIRTAPCRENPSRRRYDDTEKMAGDAAEGDTRNALELIIAKLDRERRAAAMGVIQDVMATLTEADRLLVRLVFGSDRKIAAAGRVVGFKSAAAAQRRLRSLLLQFREALLKEGIREP